MTLAGRSLQKTHKITCKSVAVSRRQTVPQVAGSLSAFGFCRTNKVNHGFTGRHLLPKGGGKGPCSPRESIFYITYRTKPGKSLQNIWASDLLKSIATMSPIIVRRGCRRLFNSFGLALWACYKLTWAVGIFKSEIFCQKKLWPLLPLPLTQGTGPNTLRSLRTWKHPR